MAAKLALAQGARSKVLFEATDASREERELNVFGGTKPIYGSDERMDWGTIRDRRIKAIAAASVALIDRLALTEEESGKIRLSALSLEDRLNLCPGQRFLKQWSSSFCSGVLVGTDQVLTAGHCIYEASHDRDAVRLESIRFAFGYTSNSQHDPGRAIFDKAQIFTAQELIAGKYRDGGDDWAVVRLDRAVPKEIAEPIRVGRTRIEKGAPIFVVGYPSGLPLKYSPGAEVLQEDTPTSFKANLDTFGGNSGSGVFSSASNELVGILVSGETDYHRSKTALCNEAYLCPRYGCSGERVIRIESVNFPSGDAAGR
jgi:V8-like Glu-specific endopeptidase